MLAHLKTLKTKVTQGYARIFSKVIRFQKLRGYAELWLEILKGYKVTEVTRLRSRGISSNPSKLQGYKGCEGYAGLPLKIHTDITKVTRLRRLQFFKIFTNKSKGYKVTEVTRLHRSMPNVFLLSFQVTMLSTYSWSRYQGLRGCEGFRVSQGYIHPHNLPLLYYIDSTRFIPFIFEVNDLVIVLTKALVELWSYGSVAAHF